MVFIGRGSQPTCRCFYMRTYKAADIKNKLGALPAQERLEQLFALNNRSNFDLIVLDMRNKRIRMY